MNRMALKLNRNKWLQSPNMNSSDLESATAVVRNNFIWILSSCMYHLKPYTKAISVARARWKQSIVLLLIIAEVSEGEYKTLWRKKGHFQWL
jgi:hypothetical protein